MTSEEFVTFQNNREFICQGNKDCPVNKGVRCACRYCRLHKCLAVGMDKNCNIFSIILSCASEFCSEGSEFRGIRVQSHRMIFRM